jgi:hypothetical protein
MIVRSQWIGLAFLLFFAAGRASEIAECNALASGRALPEIQSILRLLGKK